jgi:RNA polymerase sigma-70 factor (ECF subfamily)
MRLGSPSVAAVVEAKLAAARARWPRLRVDETAFLRHWDERLSPDADVGAAVTATHVEDLYLAFVCIAGDDEARADLDRTHFPSARRAVERIDSSAAFTEEVEQLLRIQLLLGRDGVTPRLADYRGTGPLASWIRVSAVRTALNCKRGPDERARELDPDLALTSSDPELRYLAELHASTMRAALRDAFARLEVHERNLLRLHHLDGLTTPQIAAIFRSHRTTVRRQLDDCHDKLRDGVVAYLRTQLALSGSVLDSMVRLAGGVDLSLSALLAQPDG